MKQSLEKQNKKKESNIANLIKKIFNTILY